MALACGREETDGCCGTYMLQHVASNVGSQPAVHEIGQ